MTCVHFIGFCISKLYIKYNEHKQAMLHRVDKANENIAKV